MDKMFQSWLLITGLRIHAWTPLSIKLIGTEDEKKCSQNFSPRCISFEPSRSRLENSWSLGIWEQMHYQLWEILIQCWESVVFLVFHRRQLKPRLYHTCYPLYIHKFRNHFRFRFWEAEWIRSILELFSCSFHLASWTIEPLPLDSIRPCIQSLQLDWFHCG